MCKKRSERTQWLEEACHELKHEEAAAAQLLKAMRTAHASLRKGTEAAAALEKAISYFSNHLEKMNYHLYRAIKLPIGSGVTEAACKTVAKQRLCASGMRWTLRGVSEVLSLRTLITSGNRWDQFWEKATRFGFAKINHSKRNPPNPSN